jgi:hypothetical protein
MNPTVFGLSVDDENFTLEDIKYAYDSIISVPRTDMKACIQVFLETLYGYSNAQLKWPDIVQQMTRLIYASSKLGIQNADAPSLNFFCVLLCCYCLPASVDSASTAPVTVDTAFQAAVADTGVSGFIPASLRASTTVLTDVIDQSVADRTAELAASAPPPTAPITWGIPGFEGNTQAINAFVGAYTAATTVIDDAWVASVSALQAGMASDNLSFNASMDPVKDRLDTMSSLCFEVVLNAVKSCIQEHNRSAAKLQDANNDIARLKGELSAEKANFATAQGEIARLRASATATAAAAAAAAATAAAVPVPAPVPASAPVPAAPVPAAPVPAPAVVPAPAAPAPVVVVPAPAAPGAGGGPADVHIARLQSEKTQLQHEVAKLHADYQRLHDYAMQDRAVAQSQHAVSEKIAEYYGGLYDFLPARDPEPLGLP